MVLEPGVASRDAPRRSRSCRLREGGRTPSHPLQVKAARIGTGVPEAGHTQEGAPKLRRSRSRAVLIEHAVDPLGLVRVRAPPHPKVAVRSAREGVGPVASSAYKKAIKVVVATPSRAHWTAMTERHRPAAGRRESRPPRRVERHRVRESHHLSCLWCAQSRTEAAPLRGSHPVRPLEGIPGLRACPRRRTDLGSFWHRHLVRIAALDPGETKLLLALDRS